MSLIVTLLPLNGVGAFCRCTQYVYPVELRYRYTRTWPLLGVKVWSDSAPIEQGSNDGSSQQSLVFNDWRFLSALSVIITLWASPSDLHS